MTSYEDLKKIQKATQTLLNPFEKESDFNIILQLPKKFEKWEDFGIEKIIDQALYKFEVNIDSRGQTIQGIHKDNNPYSKHYQEEEILNYKTKDILDGEKCIVKAVKVWIYHFHRGAGYRSLWPSASYGILTRDDYNERLAGFRLYKDSVRVFPYGRKGNDWLELDYMQNKERSVDWFGNTQIVAAARFDMTANQGIIIDKANREGLEDSVGQRQLFKILQQLVKKMRALVNRDYPAEAPDHLKEVDFEYGSFSSEVEREVNFSVRSLGGTITTAFKITKGKKPEWLKLDAGTGNFTGKAEKVEEIALEVTAGNSQGNHTAKISISINPKPIVEVDEDDEEQTTKPAEENDDKSGGEGFPLPPSSLDIAISEIRRDLNQLLQETDADKKVQMLSELNSRIKQVLSDEGFEI